MRLLGVTITVLILSTALAHIHGRDIHIHLTIGNYTLLLINKFQLSYELPPIKHISAVIISINCSRRECSYGRGSSKWWRGWQKGQLHLSLPPQPSVRCWRKKLLEPMFGKLCQCEAEMPGKLSRVLHNNSLLLL